jgi:DNA polymerase-3 subunit delta'
MPFRDLQHRRLASLLARSVSRDALPPSLIFSGPDAAGMRDTAIATAQAINCLQPTGKGDERDACGVCAACSRIARGMHPDVIVVEPGDNASGSIKVEQVRDVIDRAGFRPFEGRRRVVIIDQADMLMAGAQNALLNTSE